MRNWIDACKEPLTESKKSKSKSNGDNPCWDGYTQYGMKKKGKKEVPNCVPDLKEDTSGRDPQTQECIDLLHRARDIIARFQHTGHEPSEMEVLDFLADSEGCLADGHGEKMKYFSPMSESDETPSRTPRTSSETKFTEADLRAAHREGYTYAKKQAPSYKGGYHASFWDHSPLRKKLGLGPKRD